MKKLFFLITALSFFAILSAQTKISMNYRQRWEKVAGFEQKSLPKSASEEVNNIFRQAVADKNSPQAIKALIHQAKYNLAIDAEKDALIFENLNEMLAESTDKVEKAVLHSMLGELYLNYYRKDSWNINQRTALIGYIPADMAEWTKNLFYDKAIEHFNASLTQRLQLEKTQVQTYADVVDLGNDSHRFFPSMYDFLARRALLFLKQLQQGEDMSRSLWRKGIAPEALFMGASDFIKLQFNPAQTDYNLWVLEIYRRYLSSLQQRRMEQSMLLVELEKIDYLQKLDNVYRINALPALQNLFEKWKNKELSVEITERIAGFYLARIQGLYEEEKPKKEEKLKELYELLQKEINRFPHYEHIAMLKNKLTQLTHPEISISGNRTFSSKSEKKLNVFYKNIDWLKAKLYKINSPINVWAIPSNYLRTNLPETSFLKEFSVDLPPKASFLNGETSFSIPVNQLGAYLLVFETDKPIEGANNRMHFYFSVSDLAVFSRSSDESKCEFFVVNRTTGSPLPNAKINIYKLSENRGDTQLTPEETIPVNRDGLAVYDKKNSNQNLFYQAVLDNDNGSLLTNLPVMFYEYDDAVETQKRLNLFTDRALYRPGQTLFFKGIFAAVSKEKSVVKPGKSIELELRDTNDKTIARQALKTNEFGSISGEFILPQTTLSGNFSIHSEWGSVGFRVEEYKRPTFEISFEKIDKTYKFGEQIALKGKVENYSGIKLQNASVNYRITRQETYWWRWNGISEHFAEGTLNTDADGGFEIRFIPEKPDRKSFSQKRIYTFSIEVSVTDTNGETQIETYPLTVGDLSMMLHIEMPDRWEKTSAEKIEITARNLDGTNISVKGVYRIFSLHANDSLNRQMVQGTFETGEQEWLRQELGKLPSGKYRFRLQSEDDRGNKVEAEKEFILFAYSDKRPPVKTNRWVVLKNAVFSDEKPAEVLFGVSEKVNLLYELWQSNTLLERKWLKLNNENRLFSFPRRTQYKEGITLTFTHVKEGEFYTESIDLLPEKKKKTLNVKLDVFRDKIRPGAGEEWRISVKDIEGNSSLAEVLAGMYDFSLDKIYPAQEWRLSFDGIFPYLFRKNLQQDGSFHPRQIVGYIKAPIEDFKPFDFDRFNWFGFSFFSSSRVMIRGLSSKESDLSENIVIGYGVPIAKTAGTVYESDPFTTQEASDAVAVQPSTPSQNTENIHIRRNFNETAFFFPQLRTNEKGEVQIAFTVPESNTRWRFRVLTHDKNLNTGQAEAFTVSQKELMITPNMPRFLRQGDRTSISAKISNLSGDDIDGDARIEFFNPVTDQPLSLPLGNASQSFALAPKASSDVSWIFDVPAGIDLIGIRIIAAGQSFSDGEQHALPVLPNQMQVTESMRMDVNGNQNRTFSFDKLLKPSSPTAQNYRLTLEFTSNPTWYAVQALPLLSAPDNGNAVAWFASYYANTLGVHIAQAYPKISAVIEAWKKQGGNKETLLSNLEKNQELKNILLEETPWVLQAHNESEQKQKLSLLFDFNRSQYSIRTAFEKLKELQTTQGGWSWFQGFHPSVSITQYILYGFSRLQELQIETLGEEIGAMQSEALFYIDSEALRRFEQRKNFDKNWRNTSTISLQDLEYLYVRSAYTSYPINPESKDMIDFYTSVVEKNWTRFGLYERSLIAVLLQRKGKSEIVRNILKSFREHAVVSDETGVFWPNNRTEVFFSQSAVSVHTFIMDAFRTAGAETVEIDNMKRWLLKQKQTQLWETVPATLDAVYTLLSSGSDWLSIQDATTITLGGQTVEPGKTELGTGYFKESWNRSEIRSEMGRIEVAHRGNTPAWGALYLQYFDVLDNITKTDARLDVGKKLFVEQTDASGKKLVAITGENPLKIGDKVVVRLTVRTDRDLEFVHLKDMRAPCLEPAEKLSGMHWQDGIRYYQTSKDASVNLFFDTLPRGVYLFEYTLLVNRAGNYSNGITSIQCMYAPEFTSHTSGMRIIVKE